MINPFIAFSNLSFFELFLQEFHVYQEEYSRLASDQRPQRGHRDHLNLPIVEITTYMVDLPRLERKLVKKVEVREGEVVVDTNVR